MAQPRLIIASARLPVTITRQKDGWEAAHSPGGLVTALKAVIHRRPSEWIGWPGTHIPDGDRDAVTRLLAQHGSAPVYVSKADADGFYLGFSNRVLWPLLHNLQEHSHFDLAAWKAYERVNETFAETIARAAKPHDVIWVHDYQLSLVPELLRRRGVTCPIGYFLHIPFPSAETYRTLPVREEILRGMLGADLIGFHTYEYVSHFRSACLRVLGCESEMESIKAPGHHVRLAALPIGIDPEEVREMVRGPEARQELENLQTTYAGKKLIVGVDRLDYTKGIAEKLLGFEELLRAHPRWRQRAVLVQVAAPSRTGVDDYQKLKRDIDELVGRINGKYGSPTATPVVYINQSFPRERLAGVYRAADVALVTPVRDGMNLVALEYIAARAEHGNGTLILSEFAGAAHSLPGAKLVNPFNVTEVAEALRQALEKPPNAEGFQHMLHFVDENTSMAWANAFLDRLEACATEAQPRLQPLRVEDPALTTRVREAERPLVLLDYDGTLRSFVLDPEAATPDRRILAVLEQLGRMATTYVVSGRSAAALDRWLGELPIGLVAEHGLAIKPAGGRWEQQVEVNLDAIKALVEPLFRDFNRRTPGTRCEYKRASMVWHYRGADPEYGAFQANELFALLEEALRRRPYHVLRGNRVIEVRHQAATKGQALLTLLKRHSKADLLFCAGDDRTDEEMMLSIPPNWKKRAICCWVGRQNAHATHWVPDNLALLGQLERVIALWSRAGAAAPARGRSARATVRGEPAARRQS
jgi:trehalose 6-phosphate synthase/phosphatase